VAVPEEQLPVVLPYVENFHPTGTGESPLASDESFARTTCPKCGRDARRETDVSDTFLDSSWYFLRYPSVGFDNKPFDEALTKKWLPVDAYLGGKEHAVLHLLYSRFITMALHDMGFIEFEEPYQKFRAHGLLILRGAKMSKSKGNVVTPDEYYDSHGADTLRTYLMFTGPYEEGGDFTDRGIEGAYRFLNKVWELVQRYHGQEVRDGEPSGEALQTMHRTIKKLSDDIPNLKFNTAIAALMEWVNDLQQRSSLASEELRTLLQLLAPIAPYVSEELWEQIGEPYSVHQTSWPEVDEALAKAREMNVAVQIDGKTREVIKLAAGADEASAVAQAKASEKVSRHLDGRQIARTIYLPDRLVNFVTKA
jgi:leucyl-tRNA synthetase